MRKFDLSLRSSRSSYFATFRHQLTILSKTDALDEEKWLNMLGTFVRSEERFSRNAETDLVCRLLLEKKREVVVFLVLSQLLYLGLHLSAPRLFTTDTVFFFNDRPTTEIYTLSLHDALPISLRPFAIN